MKKCLNLDDFRFRDETRPVSDQKLPRHRKGKRFLKGPIPWDWLSAAMSLPMQSLAVGILLWDRAWMAGGKRTFTFNPRNVSSPLSVFVIRRSLHNLESAGLISIKRRHGRLSVVTINDCPSIEDEMILGG